MSGSPWSRTSYPRSLHKVEHVPLGFADAAADRGEFDRRGMARQVALGLEPADDAPAQRGHRQPPAKCIAVEVEARGLLISGEKAFDAAKAARTERGRCAEPPGPDAEPGQILVDLADVHEFPVQH